MSRFIDSWINTHAKTKGIERFTHAECDGIVNIRVCPKGGAGDWGEAKVVPHAELVSLFSPEAFSAVYHFGYIRNWLAANNNKGIIIAADSTFIDADARSNVSTRELFYHDMEAPR